MTLLLLANFGLVWLLVSKYRARIGLEALSIRGTLVVAQFGFQLAVVAITEGMSFGHHFTATVVGWSWVVLLLGQVVLARHELTRGARALAVKGKASRIAARLRTLGVGDNASLAAIAGIFGVLAVIGGVYPPNNGDSMVYHLVRVVHWIQNRSVAQFATHYLAQIELAPLHEYNLAHLHLLSGGDRLDGYVQLLAAVMCVVGASEVARLLGARRRGQIMAALICATIPSAILEATSTQNNYFGASIGMGLLLVLLAWRTERGWIPRAVLLGCGAGFAVLAKGTLPALLAPACVALGLLVVVQEARVARLAIVLRRALVTCLIAGASACLIVAPFFVRNVDVIGGLVGPVSKSTISTNLTPRAAAANVVRSTAANFMIGDGKHGIDTAISKLALRSFGRLYRYVAVDPGDPNYSLGTDFDAFAVKDYRERARLEDFGANPWHVVLLVGAGSFLVVAAFRRRDLLTAAVLAVGLGCGYLLFTATARWSVFEVRYQVPLLVAWSPVVAVALERAHWLIGRVVMAFLVLACLPQLLDNGQRSLIHPRYEFSSFLARYFEDFSTLRSGYVDKRTENYEDSTQALDRSSCHRLGIANWVLVEYPLWANLDHLGWKGEIEDVDVTNESAKLEHSDFKPCALIRQVTPDYTSADEGMVTLRYGELALSIESDQASPTEPSVAGFSSLAEDLAVAPGEGWSIDPQSEGPVLVGDGSLYVWSATPRRIQIELQGTPPSTPLIARGPDLEPVPVTVVDGHLEIELSVERGPTRVRLSAGSDGATAKHVPMIEVVVAA